MRTAKEIGDREHKLFTMPDGVKYPKRKTPEALAFLVTQSALESWPTDVAITPFDVELVAGSALNSALTIHLNELAEF